MAQQVINVGTGDLSGDGESIRSAFIKVNDNFTEIYEGGIGNSGTSGPTGPIGYTGSAGNDGADSTIPGPTGPIGYTGSAGNDGADSTIPGPTGPSGVDGVEGPQGPIGYTGSAGADSTVEGPSGPIGYVGSAGNDGADSTVPGPTGPSGVDGAEGPQGPIGDSGPAGISPNSLNYLFQGYEAVFLNDTFISFNGADNTSTTKISISSVDINGGITSDWIGILDTSTATPKGILHIAEANDPSIFAIYDVTEIDTFSSTDVYVSYVTGNGTFISTNNLVVGFVRHGNEQINNSPSNQLAFYNSTGTSLSGSAGVEWFDQANLLRIGNTSSTGTNVQYTRYGEPTSGADGFIFTQIHNSADAVNFTFARSRGNETEILPLVTGDDVVDLSFVAESNPGLTPTTVAGITVRVENTASTRPAGQMLFYVYDGASAFGSVGLEISSTGTVKTDAISALNSNTLTSYSHIVPSDDLTYDLGSPDKQWRSLYVGSITAPTNTNLVLTGGPAEAPSNGGNVKINGGGTSPVQIDQIAGNGVWLGKSDGTGGDVQTYSRLHIHRGVVEPYEEKENATGVVDHDCDKGHLFYHTSPDANWTVNLTNLNEFADMSTNIVIIIEQGGTPYYPNALQIGGSAQTIKWLGNATPTPQANKTEIATFTIFYNGSTYNVLGSYSTYG